MMDPDRLCLSGMKELSDNVLPFWLNYVNSTENDAFIGVIDSHGVADTSADLSSILFFRVLWSFSASYRASGRHEYMAAATKIYGFITTYFHDANSGFFYDHISAERIPIKSSFSTITQSYAIYSLAEFCSVFSEKKNKDKYNNVSEGDICTQLLELTCRLELLAKTQPFCVYRDAIDIEPEDNFDKKILTLTSTDNIDVRCQMHLLEAFSNLFRITGNDYICGLLTELLLVFEFHVFSKYPETMTLKFDASWRRNLREVSYGHNMECAWILYEASKLIDNEPLKQCLNLRMIELVNCTYDLAVNKSGAMITGMTETGEPDERIVWWVQTEAINGLLACFELTGEKEYLYKAQSLWGFVQKQFRDEELGEWFTELTSLGVPNITVDKVGPWRGPYHITRTCLKLSAYLKQKSESAETDIEKNGHENINYL